jgi:hypothetical protein
MRQIEDISNRGAEIRSRLCELLSRHELPTDTKTAFLTGFVSIALEHHEAIFLLIKSKLTGSAFALVRLLFDTTVRALWINKVANESQIEKMNRDKLKFPRMSQMLAEIDQNYDTDNFFQSLKEAWKAMCSYAHSGALQIARRFTNGEVKPSYSDDEIVQALNVTNTVLMLLTRMFFVSMGWHQEADETEKMMLEYDAVGSD